MKVLNSEFIKELNSFTEEEKQVLLGTLFGDAGIHSDGRYMELWHSKEQEDYMKWKIDKLKKLIWKLHSRMGYDEVTNDYREEIYATTKSSDFIEHLGEIIYIKEKNKNHRRKVLREELLYMLKPLGLAVWYMDDGSFNKDAGGYIELSTQSFTIKENKLIIKMLKDKFNITGKIKMDNSCKKPEIRLNVENTKKFFNLIRPYIISNLVYKLGENFTYSQLRLKKEFEFEYGHRLDGYANGKKGTCGNPAGHGHSAKLVIGVAGKVNPKTNMVIDFGDIKKIVNEKIVQRLDHSFLNVDIPEIGYPTAENMIFWIWKELKPFLPNLYFIKLNETSTSSCELEIEVKI